MNLFNNARETSRQIPPAERKEFRIVGSKGGAGIPQWLISLMPAHRTFVEAFGGRGKIIRTKVAAARNILIELDGDTLTKFEQLWMENYFPADLEAINGCALEWLPRLQLTGNDLVYADPPYLRRVCADKTRRYYRHDGATDEWHNKFLDVITSLRCMVIVSGYESDLYAARIGNWRSAYKWTVNRGGARVKEFVWMNFQEPALLHDTRFVGDNFTDRQRVTRKMDRWEKNFLKMSPGEQWAMYWRLGGVLADNPPGLARH